jgi:DNA-binding winged helix-turn-helix (wHTH) protein
VSNASDLQPPPTSTLVFGRFELDGALLELRRDGRPVPLGPKAFAFLQLLLIHRDRVVPREEIFARIWPEIRVSDAALRSVVHEARLALDDTAAETQRIATLRGRGFRFVGQVEERASAPAPREPARARPAPDFVDRERELAVLREALHAAERGERRVVLLQGAPGIGKTRIATELGNEAARAGFAVHLGRALEGGSAPPYWPWIQILRSLAGGHDSDDESADAGARARLEDLCEELGPTSAASHRDLRAAGSARFRWLDSVARLLGEAAELRPRLVILDDLHAADEASVQLLVFVVQRLPRGRLLVLGTQRDLTSSSPLGQVLHEPGTQTLRLTGMDREAVAHLLEQSLREAPGSALVERIHAASGGNPLFVAELVRQLRGRSARALACAPIPVPARLRDAIWTRLAECTERCRRVLRVASVARGVCTLSLLRRVMGGSNVELLEALGEAEERDLLLERDGCHDFTHGVIRELIYEELSPIDRMRLHESVGEALEWLCGPDAARHLAELAHHFGAAAVSQPDRALHYAQRAARSAAGAFAYREASALYRSALAALAYVDPDPELRCFLLIELGEVLQLAGEPREAFLGAFHEAMRLARAAQLPASLGRAAERCVVHLNERGELLPYAQHRGDPLVRALREALEEVTAAVPCGADAELLARSHTALAILGCAEHERSSSCEAIDVALDLAMQSGDASLHGHVLRQKAELGILFDLEAERSAYPDRLLELAQRSMRLDLEAQARLAQLILAVERGDRDAAERAGRCVERLEARRPSGPFGPGQSWSVLRALLDGCTDAAQTAMLGAIRQAARGQLHDEWTGAAASTFIWWLCLLRGTSEFLAVSLESYIAARIARPVLPVFDLMLARTHAELGRLDEAGRRLEGLAEQLAELPRSGLWLVCLSLLAEVCALCERADLARAPLELLRPYAGRVAMVGDFMCLGLIARPLGSLAALLGRWDEAERHFAQASRHACALRAPILSVQVQLDHARALTRHPDAEERLRAPGGLEDAALAARALGLGGVERRAEVALKALRSARTTKPQRSSHTIPTSRVLSRS